MSDTEREERIRARAHEIWERNGRREGSQTEDWEQARREIEMEDEDAAGLKDTLTETMGLAVGIAEDERQEEQAQEASAAPAEGDRKVVERQLSRKKK